MPYLSDNKQIDGNFGIKNFLHHHTQRSAVPILTQFPFDRLEFQVNASSSNTIER